MPNDCASIEENPGPTDHLYNAGSVALLLVPTPRLNRLLLKSDAKVLGLVGIKPPVVLIPLANAEDYVEMRRTAAVVARNLEGDLLV